MSYRVEISKNNRAGCTDTVCKAEGVKITKGEMRLGTWLQMPGIEHGSWKWKHWGCVSGQVLLNIREKIGDGEGHYDWDALDGYDELDEEPEVQEKIRRVITQGCIDPEDFKGDPELNKLGQKGIRNTRRKKKAAADDDAEGEADAEPAKGGTAKAASAEKKAAGAEKKAAGAEKKAAGAEKKAAGAEKKAAGTAKKASGTKRGRKPTEGGDAEDEAVLPPKKKAGGPAAKKQPKGPPEAKEEPVAKRRTRSSRSKAVVQDDDGNIDDEEEEEEEAAPVPVPKKRGRRGKT